MNQHSYTSIFCPSYEIVCNYVACIGHYGNSILYLKKYIQKNMKKLKQK